MCRFLSKWIDQFKYQLLASQYFEKMFGDYCAGLFYLYRQSIRWNIRRAEELYDMRSGQIVDDDCVDDDGDDA